MQLIVIRACLAGTRRMRIAAIKRFRNHVSRKRDINEYCRERHIAGFTKNDDPCATGCGKLQGVVQRIVRANQRPLRQKSRSGICRFDFRRDVSQRRPHQDRIVRRTH